MSEVTCVLCNSKLNSKKELQDHFRKHANKEIDNKGRAVAKIMKTLPNDKSTERQHATKEIDNSGHEKNSNNIHTLTKPEVGIQKVSCSNAKQSDSPQPELSKDKQNVTFQQSNHQRFSCEVCHIYFESAAYAMTHKWRLHPTLPFKYFCSHCGKQFPLKAFLDNHISEEHQNSKPQEVLICDECGEKFYNKSALDYHAKVGHKRVDSVLRPLATPPPSKKIKLNNAGEAQSVYYCHFCGSEYIQKYNLRKHIEQRHPEEETNTRPDTEIIRCTICDALFLNKKAYEVHNLHHQPDDMYVTSEEHRLKTISRVDQDFDLRRVQIQIPKTIQGYAKQQMNIVWKLQQPKSVPNTKFNLDEPSYNKKTEIQVEKINNKSGTQGIKLKSGPKILLRSQTENRIKKNEIFGKSKVTVFADNTPSSVITSKRILSVVVCQSDEKDANQGIARRTRSSKFS